MSQTFLNQDHTKLINIRTTNYTWTQNFTITKLNCSLYKLELILACNDTFAYLIRDESMQFCRCIYLNCNFLHRCSIVKWDLIIIIIIIITMCHVVDFIMSYPHTVWSKKNWMQGGKPEGEMLLKVHTCERTFTATFCSSGTPPPNVDHYVCPDIVLAAETLFWRHFLAHCFGALFWRHFFSAKNAIRTPKISQLLESQWLFLNTIRVEFLQNVAKAWHNFFIGSLWICFIVVLGIKHKSGAVHVCMQHFPPVINECCYCLSVYLFICLSVTVTSVYNSYPPPFLVRSPSIAEVYCTKARVIWFQQFQIGVIFEDGKRFVM